MVNSKGTTTSLICPFEDTADGNTGDIKEEHLRAYYRSGYLEALFGLVNAKKISLNDAAEYAGISYGEAEELLQGWKEAHDP